MVTSPSQGLLTPNESGGESDKDQRKNDKRQRNFLFSVSLSLGVNGPQGCAMKETTLGVNGPQGCAIKDTTLGVNGPQGCAIKDTTLGVNGPQGCAIKETMLCKLATFPVFITVDENFFLKQHYA